MKPGSPLNDRLLRDDMRRIAGMGHWQNIEFHLEQDSGRNILHIMATPKSWGPTYLEAGLDFEIDDASAGFDLSLLIDATELNRLGADWKTALRIGTDIVAASQFFQPVDYSGRFFVSPRASWSQTPRDIFFDEERVAEYRIREATAGLDAGMVLGHLLSFGQVSIGVERGRGNAERRVGVPQFPDLDFDTAGFVANLRIDQLDNLWFPRSGYFADVEFFASRTDLGADFSFNRGRFFSFGAHSVGRWTGTARVSYGDDFNSELPVFALFSLGGFRNLSGRPRDQLLGSTQGFGSLEVRYRVTATGGAVVKGVYLGASAETGNVWAARSEASLDDLRTAGSVYVVTDSLLGPLYIAYGQSNKKNRAFYLFLNRTF